MTGGNGTTPPPAAHLALGAAHWFAALAVAVRNSYTIFC